MLGRNVEEGSNIVLSMVVEEDGETYYRATLERGLEGIISKKKGSKYERGRRSGNWLKMKKAKDCDCVVFGYTKGKAKRADTFGALILTLYHENVPLHRR